MNITIYDKVSTSGWHSGVGQGNEDQETEPGTVGAQVWDLEAFDLTGNKLSMVGGYNFLEGQGGYLPGHIFMDFNGDAVWGQDVPGLSGNGTKDLVNSSYHYDYALTYEKTATNDKIGSYKIYALSEDSMLLSGYYRINDESNPWRFVPQGEQQPVASGNFAFEEGLSDADTGFLGGEHYAIAFDLGTFLDDKNLDGALFKYTYGCGNDNLVGQVQSVPDGLGFAGCFGLLMAVIAHRKLKPQSVA